MSYVHACEGWCMTAQKKAIERLLEEVRTIACRYLDDGCGTTRFSIALDELQEREKKA